MVIAVTVGRAGPGVPGKAEVETIVAPISDQGRMAPSGIVSFAAAMTQAPASPRARHGRNLAAIAVALVGLQQGLIPLVLRLTTGHHERFALASYLPSPWWWIACLVIMVAAATLLAVVDTDRTADATSPTAAALHGNTTATGASVPSSPADQPTTSGDRDLDAASGLVFLVGVYNGVLPFGARLFDTTLFLALPTRLPAPWWWLASLAICVATAVTLWWLDQARSRRLEDD